MAIASRCRSESDVAGVTHMASFDLPNVPEAYIHCIGRTAQAGVAISLCNSSEREFLRQIERPTRVWLVVEEPRGGAA